MDCGQILNTAEQQLLTHTQQVYLKANVLQGKLGELPPSSSWTASPHSSSRQYMTHIIVLSMME